MRITVGSPIDTTTLAGYCTAGLERKVTEALRTSMPVDAMHDLHKVITSAIDMETKLNLSAKQVPRASADSA